MESLEIKTMSFGCCDPIKTYRVIYAKVAIIGDYDTYREAVAAAEKFIKEVIAEEV